MARDGLISEPARELWCRLRDERVLTEAELGATAAHMARAALDQKLLPVRKRQLQWLGAPVQVGNEQLSPTATVARWVTAPVRGARGQALTGLTQRRRLDVAPGMTGLWQVSGRSKLTFDEMVMLDLFYAENWSLFLDFKILLRTVPTVLRGTGAY